MKTLPFKLFVMAILMSFAGGCLAQEAQWTTDYEKALEKAKGENKVVLLDFTGSDWCGWCMKMKDETLGQAQFKHYARKNLVLVEVDFPKQKTLPAPLKEKNEQLKKKFNVHGYPSFVLVDKDGKELGRQVGYLQGGPAAFIAKLGTWYTPVENETGNGWGTNGTWGSSGSSSFFNKPAQ